MKALDKSFEAGTYYALIMEQHNYNSEIKKLELLLQYPNNKDQIKNVIDKIENSGNKTNKNNGNKTNKNNGTFTNIV